MAYHGHERSRHHNYSRNSQSRNRRSENQGFAPANYIYSPDRFLRQLPPYRRDIQQRGPGPSQQYLKGRSYHNRPYSAARVRSPLVQKRLPPQRKRTRRNMHPPGESAAASKSSEQSKDVEKEPNSEDQRMEEDNSSNAVQASVPQTRSSAKAQQNKSEENTDAQKGDTEDGSGMSQASNPQTRSSTKAHNKSEEVVHSDKSENDDSDNKVSRTTRGNSKIKNDDKSSCAAEVHLIEERVTGHNTRSATKARLDVSDESELQEEGSNTPKTRKLRKDTKTTVPATGDTERAQSQESEGPALANTEKTSHAEDHLAESRHVSEDLDLDMSGTEECTKETVKSEELVTANDNESSTLSNVKQLVGNKSPRLILHQIDTHAEKHRELSSEKVTNITTTSSDIIEVKDSPRRSSRLGSSKIKTDETQLPNRTLGREHSRTPVRIQQSVEPKESGESFPASIRSITCRRSIRDSPSISNINDSFQKQRAVKHHIQVTVKKTNKEYLSGSNLDISTEKSTDVTTESDESSVSREKLGKRKASTLETVEKDQEHKKKCTLKSEQNSIISAVSSPLQLTQKPEPVGSSTPLKVVECCETVHMELSEESITDESAAYEKARDNISEQSLSLEKGAPAPEQICEPASRKWCSIM